MSYQIKLRNGGIKISCVTVEDTMIALKISADGDEPTKIVFNEAGKLHIFSGKLLFLARLISIEEPLEEPLGEWLEKPDAVSYEETYVDGTTCLITSK